MTISGLNRLDGDTAPVRQAKQKARAVIKKVYQQQLRESETPAEKHLWEAIKGKQLGVKFTPQAVMYGFIPDFWCGELKLIIEVDGSIHKRQEAYDHWREAILKSHKIHVLRFTNKDVFRDRDACVVLIQETIKRLSVARHRRRSTIKRPKWKADDE